MATATLNLTPATVNGHTFTNGELAAWDDCPKCSDGQLIIVGSEDAAYWLACTDQCGFETIPE